jgi:tyrosyl-tRNA synthetase
LIGDFTTLIGDPTDKEAVRPKLTREEILENCKNYKQQAAAFLDFEGENPAEVRYNSEWSDKVTFRELIELSSNFTVQQMLQRDMFQKRLLMTHVRCRHCKSHFKSPVQFGSQEAFISSNFQGNMVNCPICKKETGLDKGDLILEETEKPIYLHEFLYPLAQAYDSVAMDVDLEIGGTDQLFNMMRGRDLQRIINNKEKFVMTMKILADDNGKKMGKSEGNAVFLDQSPENIYGAIMSWPDGFIANTFELMTDVPMEEIEKMRKDMKEEKVNPMDLKKRLAKEITETFCGKEEAKKAEQDFVSKFQKKDLSVEVEELEIERNETIVEILSKNGLANSKSDARRKIQQGGVSVDGQKINNVDFPARRDWDGKILKIGKKDFRKILIK